MPIMPKHKYSTEMLYNSVTDILKVYPQKNSAWMALDTCFIAEASDLGIPPGADPRAATDPWNRSFMFKPVDVRRDFEGEIIGWDLKTSVDGQEVICKIMND